MSNSFATLRTVAYQAPLSMGFSRQKVGSHALLQGNLPNPGTEILISATTNDIFVNILHMIWVYITFLWNMNILGRVALLSLRMVMINPMCSPG